MAQPLDATEIAELAISLLGWEVADDGCAIVRSLVFGDFVAVFGFMTGYGRSERTTIRNGPTSQPRRNTPDHA